MKKGKRILYAIIIILVIIQFFRPSKNLGESFTSDDITYSLPVNDEVKNILSKSCFDCHSNHTNHMWYENIQPLGWWISKHITDGKKEINFSEFNTYKPKRKAHKFKEIVEMVEEDEMPLPSYLILCGHIICSPPVLY